jgi:hypothetical protein
MNKPSSSGMDGGGLVFLRYPAFGSLGVQASIKREHVFF